MLTPGMWQQTGNVWDAWLNPSFLPSTLIRTVSAFALAGIFAAIVAGYRRSKYNAEERSGIVAWGARFLIPLAVMPPLAYWYFSTVSASARELAMGGTVAMTFIFAFGMITSFLIAFYAFFGMLRKPQNVSAEAGLLMLAIAVIATGSMEFVREGIRKPYVLVNVMYSNGILVRDVPLIETDGILKYSTWVKPDTAKYSGTVAVGEAVYRAECLRCHEIEGYNGMIPLIREWNRPLVMSALDHLDRIKNFMPPFIGTAEEKQALGDYMMTLTRKRMLASDTMQTVAPPDTSVQAMPEGGVQ
jgi:hypothetical protein